MAEVLIDTSAVYALLDRSDRNHTAAVGCLRALRDARDDVMLTNLLVAESHALILVRLGSALARRWLLGLSWPVERATLDDERRARDIIDQWADKEFSYTDAVSFAVMERRRIRSALAFDRHFEQFGWHLFRT